jgi:hypothetical protein
MAGRSFLNFYGEVETVAWKRASLRDSWLTTEQKDDGKQAIPNYTTNPVLSVKLKAPPSGILF